MTGYVNNDDLMLVMGVFVSLTLEQQELCRVRLKLLQFIDRLLTYQVRCTFLLSFLFVAPKHCVPSTFVVCFLLCYCDGIIKK